MCMAMFVIIELHVHCTYIYGIGNGRAPPIVMHWTALKHSPNYLVLARIYRKATFKSDLSRSWTNC